MPQSETYNIAEYASPLGTVTIVFRGDTVCLCEFAAKDEPRVTQHLQKYYQDVSIMPAALSDTLRECMDRYFAGELTALDALATAPRGSQFEKSVWAALRQIPAGATENYGGLAKKVGGHARAIGRANGANPIALIQPCHRVIGSNGSLTGYAGGLERKAWLLAHEGAGFLPL